MTFLFCSLELGEKQSSEHHLLGTISCQSILKQVEHAEHAVLL